LRDLHAIILDYASRSFGSILEPSVPIGGDSSSLQHFVATALSRRFYKDSTYLTDAQNLEDIGNPETSFNDCG